ncbi:D-arabinose 1-dehydrogenase-like Zn-dependent alcohol dehydrogenase [Neobacillus niacini]|uniref:alcohol dehydrogenase catalytic domain-containing protein n=1 Tax=Neobacillus niacini TaxID=86668 RepID=UPI00285B890C|nr:alcohol dehydrogenase catalytic domain-containing protein [Neobacillus niacini]MDR7076050.1 D-arabinose 1-dehydrogenase-like Zn-dependent alcohol dehydrogenase [Neobacillus niacini]
MKAMVIYEPGDSTALTLEDIPVPIPKGQEVLIKVHACGVCYHDVVTRNGTMKRGIKMPLIPGHEISGIIDQVGDQVKAFKIGDRVATTQRSHICGKCKWCRSGKETSCPERTFLGDNGLNGGYAEYVLVEEDNLAIVPDEVTLDDAAVTACTIGTEFNAIRDVGKLGIGEKVLVTGAGGGLGIHGVQLAKSAGGFVICITTSPEKVEVIKNVGADVVLLVGKDEEFSKKVLEVTDGYGVDVVIDNVGSHVFNSVRKSLAVGGRWILVGQLTGAFVSFNPAQLFSKNIHLLSATSTTRQQLIDSLDLVKRGLVSPHISATYPLESAAEVHRMMESGTITGRILLKP